MKVAAVSGVVYASTDNCPTISISSTVGSFTMGKSLSGPKKSGDNGNKTFLMSS